MTTTHLLDKGRALRTLRRTLPIYELVLRGVDQARALSATDGPDGWCVLEILCHVSDFEGIYTERIRRVVDEDRPRFPNVDHMALVTEGEYKSQSLPAVWAQFVDKRRALVAYLESLPAEAWGREGIYSDGTVGTVTELAINAALHEINHIEQTMKALGLSVPVDF
ncbi:MAG: DinB family protein [Chloroflexi bacterium]|nr:DinB family protein [Chloroflexota bacterium]